MALFTGKGDDGTTSFFGDKTRYSKNSPRTWALGALDEINSLIGVCKAKAREEDFKEILEEVQQSLFIIQAELAGAEKTIAEEKVKWLEEIINSAEKELPPIKSFLISGATELSALFDYARTLARRAERTVVALPNEFKPPKHSLAYLNRLSSLLYALARLAAHRAGATEQKPTYE